MSFKELGPDVLYHFKIHQHSIKEKGIHARKFNVHKTGE